MINCLLALFFLSIAFASAPAQSRPGTSPPPATGSDDGRRSDTSNKALITKTNDDEVIAAAALSKLAKDYYAWRNENNPVQSSEFGLHTWDNRLTDYSPAKMNERAQHEHALLEKIRAMKTEHWPKDQRIDWILFRSQLEGADFGHRVLKFESNNPQVYVGECTTAIFSLLKKEYDTPANRARSATARLQQMPALLRQGLGNLQNPVKLYAQLGIE